MTRPLQPSLVTELFSDPRALRPHFPRSYIPNSRLLSFGRVPNLIATFQGCFLDLIAVCILNPSGVADSSQIMDQGWGTHMVERCDAYRHFAVQCVELARHMETPNDRTVLLEMALLWSRLAEIAAKAASPP